MKLNKLCLLAFMALMPAFSMAQDVITHYAKNYGAIQWQQSTDGQTWPDIDGATTPTYSFQPQTDGYYRVVVKGDEACQPLVQTHQIKVGTFTVALTETNWNTATFKVSGMTIPRDEVVEWGFAKNYYNLGRTYQSMYREAEGTTLPDGDKFSLTCHNLLPNEKYTIRLYLKMKNGEIIYGPGKVTTTTAGLRWRTEDWTITKTAVVAKFQLEGYSGKGPTATFTMGDRSFTVAPDSNNIYTTRRVRSLSPSTAYTATATITLDGVEQSISKTVRTLTDYSTYEVDTVVKPVSHHIYWHRANVTQLTPDNIQTEYPRLVRVSPDTILLTYHGGDGTATNTDHWRDIYLQRSTDNGQTWSEPEKLMDHSKTLSTDANGWYRYADPTFTRLKNGWILMQFIGNANPETNENCQVLVSISKDGGNTWGDPITVGRGRTWEPQIVQLPGGELELLVSSEAAWWAVKHSDMKQEILCSYSTDNGETWTAYTRAAYHENCRDGMPVPVCLQGNKGVLYSIESIGSNDQPSMIYRKLTEEWDHSIWRGTQNGHRWIDEPIRGAAAPFTIQLPTGEVVVMGHMNQNGDVWQTNRSAITIGDNTGHNFKYVTKPFSNLPKGQGAYYSSFFIYDQNTIWLAYTHSYYDGSNNTKNTIEYIVGDIIEDK